MTRSRAPSPRTEIHRKPQRAHYDAATVAGIVDQALLCHIAFSDAGSVHCLPMACWRDGEHLYVHGANNARITRALLAGDCAVTITLLDGLVFARSAFRHSMNFRSVTIYGRFTAVDTENEKKSAFATFIEHVSPGRNALIRPPDHAELAGTALLRLPLAEAAAKIRNWGVEDKADDLERAVWAGVVPLALRPGQPQPEAGCATLTAPTLPAFIVPCP